MKVCLKKDLEIDNLRLHKHQEGVVTAITRDVDKHGGQFMYLIDFDTIGKLEIPQSLVDVLRL